MATLPGENLTGLSQKQTQEVTFRAVTETGSRAKEQRVKDKATVLRSRLDATPGIQGVKDMYMPLMREKAAPREDKVKEDVDAHFGWENDGAGKVKREGITKILHEQASEQAGLTHKYLEGGYDGLDDDEKQKLRDSAERIYKSRSGENEFWKTLTDAQKKTYLEKLLKDDKYRDNLEGLFDAIRKSPDESQKVTEAHAAFESAQKNAENKTRELRYVESDLNTVNTEIDEFNAVNAEGNWGVPYQRIQVLESSLPKLTTELEGLNVKMTLLRGQMAEMQRVKADDAGQKVSEEYAKRFKTEMDALTQQIIDCQTEITEKQSPIQELAYLKQRKGSLRNERGALEEERGKKETASDEAEQKRKEAEKTFEDAKKAKLSQEYDFAQGLDNIFYEAAYNHEKERFQAAAEALIAQNEEDIKKTDDLARKKILSGMNERWTRLQKDKWEEGGFFGFGTHWVESQKIVTDNKVIEGDFNTLVDGAGPEAVLRAILRQPPNNLSAEDTDLKLKDENFVREMQPKAVDQLLNYARQQNLITKEKALKISSTEWGQAAMARVFEKNKQINEQMTQLHAEGKIQGETPQEWVQELVKRKDENSFMELLMLIFGSAFMIGKEALFNEDTIKALTHSMIPQNT